MAYDGPSEQGSPTLNGSRLFKPAWSRRILDILIEAASRRDRLPWWSGIGIGALAAGVGALARLALLGDSTTRLAYVTLYPVVVVASLVGGLSAGTVAAVLCVFTIHYFFVPLVDATDVAGLAGFSLSCALVIGVTEMLRRAWARVAEVEAAGAVNERLSAIVASSSDAILCKSLDGIVTSWNAGATRLFGFSAEEMIGQSIARMIPPGRIDEEAGITARITAGERIDHYETARVAKDGHEIDVSLTISPVKDAKGNVAGVSTILRDIGDRKRAEQALRESEERLRFALSGARAAAWQWNVLTNEQIWSADSYLLHGRDPKLGSPSYQDWLACLHPDDRAPIERAMRDALERRALEHRTEYRVVFPTGEERWLASFAKIDYAPDGSPVRMSGINLDITEQKRVEQELQRLNQTLRAYSASGWALVRATDETSFLREICRIVVEDCGHAMVWVGYAEQDAEQSLRPVAHAGRGDGYLNEIRLTWADHERGRGPAGRAIRAGHHVIFQDLRTEPGFEPWRAAALRRGYAACISLPLTVNDETFGALTIYSGRSHAFSASDVSLLQKLADDLGHGIGVLRLRAERASREAALRSSEARFRALVEQATDGIFVADARGAYIDANSAGCAMLGYTREELLSLHIADVIDPAEVERIGPEVARFEGGEMVVSEWLFRRKDGSNFTGEVRGRQFADGRLQAIVIDITERKARELDLREADQRKDEFLAMLAHELRNPLAPIRYAARVLGKLDVDEPRVQWARDVIERQVAHLARLVDELLDISRIARGKINLKTARVELSELVRQACEAAQPLMSAKGHRFEIMLPEKRVTIEGDLVRLVQVLQNLLDNAAKYTPERGRVELVAGLSGREVEIEVRDNGAGIPASLLPEVFELFRQGEHGPDRSRGGLGIGLTLGAPIGGAAWRARGGA